MKINRVVTMVGATTTTGKLASDMYDLDNKTYYSESKGQEIPISEMDFQYMEKPRSVHVSPEHYMWEI